MAEPVTICDHGGFFVGGVPKISTYTQPDRQERVPHQITIGQMYVQYMIPEQRRQWPLIMIHGSTHTGAALDATPDGREGWFSYAVRNNLATFVVDQPGRGRSGFDQTVLHEAKLTGNLDLIPNISRISDDRAWTTWFGHLLPEDSTILDGTMIRHSDPGDPHPPEDPAQPSEAHGDDPPAYPIPPIENSADTTIEARIGVPHPVPWTHICAMPPGVAHTPRAPRSACDTQASRDARSGCTAPRSRPRRRGRPRGSERFGRGSLAP